MLSCSVASHSLQSHGLQPARLLCPWDFPGKNTGIDCHLLLQGISLSQGSNPLSPVLAGRFFSTEPIGKPLIDTCVCACILSLFSHVPLSVTLWTVAHQAPLFMGFSRQEYQSGLPFPPPGNLPDMGIEPASPALQADSLQSEPPGKPYAIYNLC